MSYRDNVLRTFVSVGNPNEDLLLAIVGLIGESGEVVDWAKKNYFHSKKPDLRLLALELGDVRWYDEVFHYVMKCDQLEGTHFTYHHTTEAGLLLTMALDLHDMANIFAPLAIMYIEDGADLFELVESHLHIVRHMRELTGKIAGIIGYSLTEIEAMNIAKLETRYPPGSAIRAQEVVSSSLLGGLS